MVLSSPSVCLGTSPPRSTIIFYLFYTCSISLDSLSVQSVSLTHYYEIFVYFLVWDTEDYFYKRIHKYIILILVQRFNRTYMARLKTMVAPTNSGSGWCSRHCLHYIRRCRFWLAWPRCRFWLVGGPIDTPNMDKLAANGLRYNNWHTLCSPLRACLLTGRNHHSVGMASDVLRRR